MISTQTRKSVNEVKKDILAIKTHYGKNLRSKKFIALLEITNSFVVCDVGETLSTVYTRRRAVWGG